jgi:hypothetical protein
VFEIRMMTFHDTDDDWFFAKARVLWRIFCEFGRIPDRHQAECERGRADLALKQKTVRFLANLTDNLLEPLINASNQDRASVKNHVVLARKNNVPSIDNPLGIR